jgi:DNA-binding NarL/FixJ family response regulator
MNIDERAEYQCCKRILVVDDQVHVRKGLEAILSLEADLRIVGYASNGLEAMELAEKFDPDIILIDLSMPHLDGYETIRRIRTKNIPAVIIAMDIQPEPSQEKHALEAGATFVIDKSNPDLNLIQVIRSIKTE